MIGGAQSGMLEFNCLNLPMLPSKSKSNMSDVKDIDMWSWLPIANLLHSFGLEGIFDHAEADCFG